MKKVITKKEAFKRGVREEYNPTKGMIKDSLFGGKKLDVKRYKAELERARLMDIKKRRDAAIRHHKDKEMGLRFF